MGMRSNSVREEGSFGCFLKAFEKASGLVPELCMGKDEKDLSWGGLSCASVGRHGKREKSEGEREEKQATWEFLFLSVVCSHEHQKLCYDLK